MKYYMDLSKLAIRSSKDNKVQKQPKQPSIPTQQKKPVSKTKLNLTQKQIIGIALLIIGVILIGIAILTW